MMNYLKPHIALGFLTAFVFQQLTIALHHVVVPHKSEKDLSLAFSQGEEEMNFHSCHFHYNGFSLHLPLADFSEVKNPKFFNGLNSFFNSENYIQQTKFHFLLRGPPRMI